MKDLKQKYASLSEETWEKRYNSPYVLRRYVHRAQYNSITGLIKPGETVLDVGCAEGVLSCLLAQKGAKVVGCDISGFNVTAATEAAEKLGLEKKVEFIVADAENLPFEDESFNVVVASHILEHLPDFQRSISELKRVSKNRVIIALPTILNLCSVIQVGGGNFWEINKKSLMALPIGIFKTIIHLFGKGVNENYSGHTDLPHLWRFPWIMRRDLETAGLKIVRFEASTLCLPYFNFLLPLIKFFDKFRAKFFLRNFGYGSMAVLKKEDGKEEKMGKKFAFGKNWKRYIKIFSQERVEITEKAIKNFFNIGDLRGKIFMDIGCGSGICSLAALRLGADVISFDADKDAVECCEFLKNQEGNPKNWRIYQGSILDKQFLSSLPKADIVYSDGVLHHTGKMWEALANAKQLVAPDGYLYISIYNKMYGWFGSQAWARLKRFYLSMPKPVQLIWEWLYFLRRAILPFIIRFKNPLKEFKNAKQYVYNKRGNDYWVDVRDWLGGYPYEAARPDEIFNFYKEDFTLINLSTRNTLALNAFLFKKK